VCGVWGMGYGGGVGCDVMVSMSVWGMGYGVWGMRGVWGVMYGEYECVGYGVWGVYGVRCIVSMSAW
jgi:hypothetical protein